MQRFLTIMYCCILIIFLLIGKSKSFCPHNCFIDSNIFFYPACVNCFTTTKQPVVTTEETTTFNLNLFCCNSVNFLCTCLTEPYNTRPLAPVIIASTTLSNQFTIKLPDVTTLSEVSSTETNDMLTTPVSTSTASTTKNYVTLPVTNFYQTWWIWKTTPKTSVKTNITTTKITLKPSITKIISTETTGVSTTFMKNKNVKMTTTSDAFTTVSNNTTTTSIWNERTTTGPTTHSTTESTSKSTKDSTVSTSLNFVPSTEKKPETFDRSTTTPETTVTTSKLAKTSTLLISTTTITPTIESKIDNLQSTTSDFELTSTLPTIFQENETTSPGVPKDETIETSKTSQITFSTTKDFETTKLTKTATTQSPTVSSSTGMVNHVSTISQNLQLSTEENIKTSTQFLTSRKKFMTTTEPLQSSMSPSFSLKTSEVFENIVTDNVATSSSAQSDTPTIKTTTKPLVYSIPSKTTLKTLEKTEMPSTTENVFTSKAEKTSVKMATTKSTLSQGSSQSAVFDDRTTPKESYKVFNATIKPSSTVTTKKKTETNLIQTTTNEVTQKPSTPITTLIVTKKSTLPSTKEKTLTSKEVSTMRPSVKTTVLQKSPVPLSSLTTQTNLPNILTTTLGEVSSSKTSTMKNSDTLPTVATTTAFVKPTIKTSIVTTKSQPLLTTALTSVKHTSMLTSLPLKTTKTVPTNTTQNIVTITTKTTQQSITTLTTSTETPTETSTIPCKCANSGTCNENGTCTCPDGFFGSQCSATMPSPAVAAATTAVTVALAASQSSSSKIKYLWPRYSASVRSPTTPHEFFRLLGAYWLTVALGINSMFGIPSSIDIQHLPKCAMAYLFGTGAFFLSLTAMIFEAGIDALTLSGMRFNAWARPAERRTRCFSFVPTFILYVLIGIAPTAGLWLRHWTDVVTPRSCIGSLGYIYGSYDQGIQNASWLQLTVTIFYVSMAFVLGILAISCNKFNVCRCRRRTEAWSINPIIYGHEIWPLEFNAYLWLVAIQPVLFTLSWISYIYVNDMKTSLSQWINLIITSIYSVTSTIQAALTTSQELNNTVSSVLPMLPPRFITIPFNHVSLQDKDDIKKVQMHRKDWQKCKEKALNGGPMAMFPVRLECLPFGLTDYMCHLWMLAYLRLRENGLSKESAILALAHSFLDQKPDLRNINTLTFSGLFVTWIAAVRAKDCDTVPMAVIKKSRVIADRRFNINKPPPMLVVNEGGNEIIYRKRVPHLAPVYDDLSKNYKNDYCLSLDETHPTFIGPLQEHNSASALVPRKFVSAYLHDIRTTQ